LDCLVVRAKELVRVEGLPLVAFVDLCAFLALDAGERARALVDFFKAGDLEREVRALESLEALAEGDLEREVRAFLDLSEGDLEREVRALLALLAFAAGDLEREVRVFERELARDLEAAGDLDRLVVLALDLVEREGVLFPLVLVVFERVWALLGDLLREPLELATGEDLDREPELRELDFEGLAFPPVRVPRVLVLPRGASFSEVFDSLRVRVRSALSDREAETDLAPTGLDDVILGAARAVSGAFLAGAEVAFLTRVAAALPAARASSSSSKSLVSKSRSSNSRASSRGASSSRSTRVTSEEAVPMGRAKTPLRWQATMAAKTKLVERRMLNLKEGR
jgi:hypothetical protein